ncbi:thioesterase family protein [Neobacillus sp. FSL H8-0543]|uniref:acyl-CoA thioesterase n=1 Tax=Neobacillus sp. FSL H8-0543 TaxID=2954672 RepID=UPI003158F844
MAFSEVEVVAKSNRFHVSNVKLYEYLDNARFDWYKYCIQAGVEAVLVHINADYKKEIFNQDRLRIRTWMERVGNTSFTLKQTVMNQRDELVVSAEVVFATIDREKRTKVTAPDVVRKLLNDQSVLDISVYKYT